MEVEKGCSVPPVGLGPRKAPRSSQPTLRGLRSRRGGVACSSQSPEYREPGVHMSTFRQSSPSGAREPALPPLLCATQALQGLGIAHRCWGEQISSPRSSHCSAPLFQEHSYRHGQDTAWSVLWASLSPVKVAANQPSPSSIVVNALEVSAH